MIPYFVLNTIHLGPFTIYTWGFFAALAFAAALFFALKEGKRKNISEETVLDLAILILIGGVAGARLLYVAENWNDYSGNLFQIFRLSEGGLMFYGGLIGAFALSIIYIRLKKIEFWKIADTIAPPLAIGEFIGRIGCTLADLHIGSITALPWGQAYSDGSIRHPIGIYMAVNGFLMFAILWISRLRLKAAGALFLFFLLWYSGTRFFLDYLRCADLTVCDPHYFGLTPSQYISAAIFLIALAIIIIRKEKFIYPVRNYLAARYLAESDNPDRATTITIMETEKQDISNEVDNQKNEEALAKNQSGKENAAVLKIENNSATGGFAKKLIGNFKKSPAMVIGAFIVGLAIGAGLLLGYYARMFKSPIFSLGGKTWVSYSQPIVMLTIVNDKKCAKCDTNDIVKQLKANALPTLIVNELDFDSPSGKALIGKFGVKSLPMLVFDSKVEKTDVFQKISSVLVAKDGQYYVNPATSGIPQGRLLEAPSVRQDDRVKGPADAPVTILEFSDFQCPYCKMAADEVRQVLAAYPDKVKFIYRHFPLTGKHADAEYAAQSSECAGDQGKFWEMHDKLFSNQDKLDKDSIAKYGRELKLDGKKFAECLASGKFKAKVDADIKSGNDYGISGTPSFFVGDRPLPAGAAVDDFKALIDEQLKGK